MEHINTVMKIFNPEVKSITWIDRGEISVALIEHWQNGGTKEELIERMNTAYKKNGWIKLINGEKSVVKGDVFSHVLSKSIDIIINELKPDVWHEEEETDFPDYMRVKQFGIYGSEKLKQVSDKFGLRSVIKSYDTLPNT